LTLVGRIWGILGHPVWLVTILAVPFLLARIPEYQVPVLAPDSHTYLRVAESVLAGRPPDLGTRPPGYPLFVSVIHVLGGDLYAVAHAQMGLTLLAALTTMFVLRRRHPSLGPLIAAAMAIFVASPSAPRYDAAILSESLFVSTLLLALSTLFLGVTGKSGRALSASSFLMGYCILVRPAGLFLVVVFLLVAAFLLWNAFGTARVLAFVAPFVLIVSGLVLYNFVTLGSPTPSTFGELNFMGATGTFQETSAAFPPEVNRAIERVRADLAPADVRVLERFWAPDELRDVYYRLYNPLVHGKDSVPRAIKLLGLPGREARRLMRDVCVHAVRSHPRQYLKFVWFNLSDMMSNHRRNFHDPIDVATVRHREILESDAHRRALIRFGTPEARITHAPPRPPGALASRLYSLVSGKYSRVARELWPWNLLFAAAFTLAIVRLITTRGTSGEAFFLFLLGATFLGSALLVALVELGIERYAYVTEFALWLSPVLALGLLGTDRRRVTSARSGAPQAKQVEWAEQWSMVEADEVFLFQDWIHPNTLQTFEGKDVLECGCGGGQHTALVARHARSITGVDLNTVEIARRRNAGSANVAFEEADIATMDLGRQFEVVFSIGVVHHTVDPDRTVANLIRHVRPGGRLILWVYSEEGNGLVRWGVEPIRRLFLGNMTRRRLLTVSKAITALMYLPIYTVYLLPLPFLPFYEYFENFRRLTFLRNAVNVFDKLNAPHTEFIARTRVTRWFAESEFSGVHISDYKGVSWRASGIRKG
jgi:SAM-dependent methyltransferase